MEIKLDRSNIEDIIPLTAMQEGMLFHSIMEPGSRLYHEQISIDFLGAMDVDLLQKAWDVVIEKNEILRTVYRWNNIKYPVQVVLKSHPLVMQNYDISGEEREKKLKAIKQADFEDRIDIEQETLRVILCKCNENDYIMIISHHHILYDGWSSGIIIKELINAYHALGKGLEPRVAFKSKFSEYVKVIRAQDKGEQKKYWERYLEGVQQNDDLFSKVNLSEMKNYECVLQKEICDRLTEFARVNGISVAILLYCAWGILAGKLNNTRDIMFGITTSGRNHPIKGIENMVGLFINTIPLRIRTTEEETIFQLLKKVNQIMKAGQEFESTPLVDINAYAGISNQTQLFHSLVVIENYPLNVEDDQEGTLVIKNYAAIERTNYNLTLGMTIQDFIALTFQYNCFTDDEMIKRIGQYFERVISTMIVDENRRIIDIDILSPEENHKILYEFNETNADYPKEKLIHQLFEEQVAKTPANTALVFDGEILTYRELNEKSNQLARRLRGKGVKPDSLVGIMMERSSLMIIGILAILKAGGAYLPIDPDYPEERVRFMLEDSQLSILLTHSWISDRIGFSGEKIVLDNVEVDQDHTGNLELVNNSGDLAYVIYTSGSTGKPKGVMIEHGSLVNLAVGQKNKYMINEDDRVLQFYSVSFDPFAEQTFITLLSGASLYLADKVTLLDSLKFSMFLRSNAITHLDAVPTYLNELDFSELKQLKRIVSGGEVCSLDLAKRLSQKFEFYNGYGPTETTITATMYHVNPKRIPHPVSIGKPIANYQVYILNIDNRLSPIGIEGELWIAGNGLARGYLNHPELTAAKFIANPFVKGGRMYRTGDLVRWLPDGNIEFLGRVDHQVKIHGFRIELGEIERQILKLGVVKETVVLAKENKGLCAYLVMEAEIAVSELRARLSESLPDYMIPSSFIQLEKIPLTPNGKVDAQALPEPVDRIEEEYVPPKNIIEEKLVQVWSEVLGREKVGIYDNFFDLGGNSLKSIKLVSVARRYGIEFSIQDVFDKPAIALLGDHITKNDHRKIKYHLEDFRLLHKLLESNQINKLIIPAKQALGDVLITGVTGWLGAHVLDKFIATEKGRAYCLVRGEDLTDSQNKLNEILTYYFGKKYANCRRIVVVCGDITSKVVLDHPIDTIFHCAASVKHYGSYSDFYDINVKGTQNVILLAKEKSAQLIHISTTGIVGDIIKEGAEAFPIIYDETKLFVGQALNNVYARSKFEAEVAVLQAKLAGLPAIVIRVGNLTNRFHDLKFQKNYQENAFLIRLKAMVDLQLYPNNLQDLKLELSPVDYTAEAIIKLAQHFHHHYSLFHVYNPKSIQLIDLINALATVEQKIKAVSQEKFLSEMEKATHIFGKEQLYELLEGKHNEAVPFFMENEFTCSYLHEIGFQWCEINDAYLKAYLQYFDQLGYWKNNN